MQTAQESVHLIAATVGFLSFALLWLSIVWGLILRNGWASTRIVHATAYGIHRTVALLGLCLGGVHALAHLAVPQGPVRLIDEFVPFLNPVDPIGIGVGVVGLEVLTATALSILIQRRLGYSRWRALHSMTYVAFMLVVGHVLISGSDTGPTWVWGSVVAAWLSTVLLWIGTTPWIRGSWRANASRLFTRGRPLEVMVDVDPVKCARFGFCEHEAPDVFRLRSDGRLTYVAAVPADQIDVVLRAMRVCPARAITVTQPRGAPPTIGRPPKLAKPPKPPRSAKLPKPPKPSRQGRPGRQGMPEGERHPQRGPGATVTGIRRQNGKPRGGSW